ncbi:MAG: DUF748 domain-containing protein [Marinomonas colpomeniae]
MTRRRFRNFVFFPFSFLVVLITIIWIATPFIAKHYLTAYFTEHDKTLSIENLSVDFFPPKIDMKNLTLTDQTQSTMSLKHAVFEVRIWPLISRTIHISEAEIDGFNITVAQQENDWIVAGINTAQYINKEDIKTEENSETSDQKESAPWKIELPVFSFTNSRLSLSRQPNLTAPAELDEISLKTLKIKDLSGEGLQWEGDITLSALVNQASLSLNSQFNYSPELINADVTIDKTSLSIESFQHFIPAPFNAGKGQLNLDSRFQFEQKQVNGVVSYELKNLNFSSTIKELNLELNDTDRVTTDTTTLALTKASVHFFSADKLEASGLLDLQSKQSTFSQSDQTIQFSQLAFALPIDVKRNEQGLTTNIENTTLKINDLLAALDNLDVDSKALNIELTDVAFTMDPQEAITASLSSQIQSKVLSVKQAENTANYELFNLSNTLSLTKGKDALSAQNDKLSIDIKGLNALQGDGKSLSLEMAKLTVEQLLADIQLPADNQFEPETQQAAPILTGTNINFSSQMLDVKMADNKRMAAWENADINELSFTQQDETFELTLTQLAIIGLTLSEALTTTKDEQALLPLSHIGKITIEDIAANQDGAKINTIVTNSLKVNLMIDAEKRIENLVFVEEKKQAPLTPTLKGSTSPKNTDAEVIIEGTPDAEQNPAFKAPYYVILNTFDTTGDSGIYVQDNSISPTLQRSLEIDTLSLRNLNTQDKEQATVFELKARNGKYSTLTSDVTIWPLADRLTMKSELVIKEAELPPYSSYIANALGYQINSGQLDLDLKLNSNDGVLDGNSHVLLRKFELGGRRESSSVVSAGAIPLNMAVGILKDSNDNIDLEIPLSGDINNPEFGWTNFMILPVRKALYSVSSSYLMQTFVPYANVISIVQFAGEQLLKVRVEPLIFEAGDNQLNDSQDVFLQQLLALMRDKKDSQLKVCGITSYLDLGYETPPKSLDADTQAIAKTLAQDRSNHLKDYLVEQGITSSRILLCSPEIDLSKSSKPRVVLTF